MYDEDFVDGGYPAGGSRPYASPYPHMGGQGFYDQPPSSDPVAYPPPRPPFVGSPFGPQTNAFTGATPTTGNPFPAPPLNMMNSSISTPNPPHGGMGMPEPMMFHPGMNVDDPVIPPPPGAFSRRAGTPYHRAQSPWSSETSDDDDDITPERRERMQPPLAPGQYGPYDRGRRDVRPALRRHGHRRAESSPAFGHDRSPLYGQPQYQQPQVIPPPGVIGGMYGPGYGAPPFPEAQVPPMYSQPEPAPPPFRPRPFSPIRRRHNPLPPPPKDLFAESPYARVLQELRKPINDDEIKARLASQAAVHTVGAIPVTLAQQGDHNHHHHHHSTRSSREKKKGKGLFRSLSARLQSRRDDDEDDANFSPPGGITQTFVGGQSTTIYPVVQTMPDGSTALIYNPPVTQMAQPGAVPVVPGQTAPMVVPPVPPVMPGYVPGNAPAVSPGVVPATSQQYQSGPPPNMGRAPSPRPGRAPSPRPGRMPSPRPGRMPSPGPGRMPSPGPGRMPSPGPGRMQSPGQMRMPTPQPAPPPPPPPPIRIDGRNEYAGLLHTSPHKVFYGHKGYSTALHLLEALRFLPNYPDYAEQVRRCGTPEEASAIASNWRHLWKPDWEAQLENVLDEVMYTKLMQHERLRSLLLQTGDRDLIFADQDQFWGEGPVGQGLNHLGRSLMRVRDRLRAEGVDA
ncbi:hypothetical protein ACG7TL_004245 [Trametes sanguinea]